MLGHLLLTFSHFLVYGYISRWGLRWGLHTTSITNN